MAPGCQSDPSTLPPDGGHDAPLLHATMAMGTRFEIALPRWQASEARLQSVAEVVMDDIRHWHEVLSAFAPDSWLSHLHRAAAGRAGPVRADRAVFDLLARCEAARVASGGCFDLAVGHLMARHGLRSSAFEVSADQTVGDPPAGPPADLPRERWITLDPDRLTVSLAPGVRLDFGAVAKGFALDMARSTLADLGIASCLLHGGTSSVLALGSPTPPGSAAPRAAGWAVALGGPGGRRLLLHNASLSVSAPSGRTAGSAHHIMDPRLGRPADRPPALAATIADSGLQAEIWSTVAIVSQGRHPATPVGVLVAVADAPGDSPHNRHHPRDIHPPPVPGHVLQWRADNDPLTWVDEP